MRRLIQAALAQVALRLAAKTIDDKRAGLILYALQTAVLNLDNHSRRLPNIPQTLDAMPFRRRRPFRRQPTHRLATASKRSELLVSL